MILANESIAISIWIVLMQIHDFEIEKKGSIGGHHGY
jgi:hypothetical protein